MRAAVMLKEKQRMTSVKWTVCILLGIIIDCFPNRILRNVCGLLLGLIFVVFESGSLELCLLQLSFLLITMQENAFWSVAYVFLRIFDLAAKRKEHHHESA